MFVLTLMFILNPMFALKLEVVNLGFPKTKKGETDFFKIVFVQLHRFKKVFSFKIDN